jgi:endonuclease/exonuclease/phosphatase family metal-dependent hydrolase
VRSSALLLLLASACAKMPPLPSGPDTRLLIAPPLTACDASVAPPARVRVATWNMDAALTSPLGDLANVLAGIDADVVLLQEVDVGTKRSGGVNQAELLARQLGTAYVFAESIPWDGGHYGLATLSRLPIAAVRRISLDVADASERRIGLELTICFGAVAIHVVNLHADIVADAGAQNVRDLVSALKASIGTGLILAGDFNAAPSDAGPQAALAAGLQDVVATRDAAATSGARRQDFIFADARVAPRVTAARVVATNKSDHNAVLADFAGPF